MVFALTEALADSVLFAMEDQTATHVVDATIPAVVSALGGSGICADEERWYALPQWTSRDGYRLLEEFTNTLHAPLAHEALKRVLISGRGVFRNFKDVLKSYPDVERKWHFFKSKKMRARLTDWYRCLCESWGLEQLEASRTDSTSDVDELVQNDFVFRQYDSVADRNDVDCGAGIVAADCQSQWGNERGTAVAALWQHLSSFASYEKKRGIVCHTQSDEFIGCALTALCPSSAKSTVTVTDFFVLQNYRGLGIGKELFLQCLSYLKANGIHQVVIAGTVVPQAMEALLVQTGFEKLGLGFVVDLF
ncbi:MAG: GNAT family N-acetyltransferase [Treponema sp.]|nr:GNAT family N-acetyltransferase [Treponema sp.]